MSGREIDEVLRTAGYEDLKKLIDYNDRVQSILVWSKHDPIISTEVNDYITAKQKQGLPKQEVTKVLLEHVRRNFDLRCLKKLSEALESDSVNRQNSRAGELLKEAIKSLEDKARSLATEMSEVNSESTKETTVTQTVKKLPPQVEQFLNCPEVTDCFRYCHLLSSGTVGELKNCGIVSREEQQQLSLSETTQSEGGRVVRDALLRDPCHEKLEKFGGVLLKEEDHINNQELAKKIRKFLNSV